MTTTELTTTTATLYAPLARTIAMLNTGTPFWYRGTYYPSPSNPRTASGTQLSGFTQVTVLVPIPPRELRVYAKTEVPIGTSCSERVYRGGSFHGTRCSKPVVVGRESFTIYRRPVTQSVEGWEGVALPDGEERLTVLTCAWYCATHDPERVKARAAKKDRACQVERARREARAEAVRALIARLGVGRIGYEPGYGPTGSVTLTTADVETLLKELGR